MKNLTAPALAAILASCLSPHALAGTAEEALAGFAPHRAVYDLELDRAESASNIAGAAGRLVFEFGGSTCEGFTVSSRFVTRLQDHDGSTRLTDLRSATYETVDPPSFTFNNRTFVNQVEQDATVGRAVREAGEVAIDLEAPEPRKVRIDQAAVFPTRQVADLLAAAEAGLKIHEAAVFDGAEGGTKVFNTTSIIGQRHEGVGKPGADDPAALESIPDDLAHWRISMSYFDLSGARGEVTPTYQLTFVLYENGVSRDLVFDYGSFALKASLKEIEFIEQVPCE